MENRSVFAGSGVGGGVDYTAQGGTLEVIELLYILILVVGYMTTCIRQRS